MRRWLPVVTALAGCDLFPLTAPHDGGHTRVPGTYLDARASPGHRAHLGLEGSKALSCRDCHFISDAGFHHAAVKACAACHGKQQEHHHPFDGGVAMTCFSCHVFATAGVDKWGCARCHVEPRGGAPHVGVHTEKCESCHRPHGAPFTKAADCGQCHDLTVSHGRGEKAFVADTCMACHPHHSKAVVAAGQCTGCHFGGAVPAKARVQPGALFAKGHVGCSSCHAPHRFTADAAKDCRACHSDTPVLAVTKHATCESCHDPHAARAAPRTCESCHPKEHVQHPKDAEGRACLGCHPVHSAGLLPAKAVSCVTCHRDAIFTTAVVHAKETPCAACHKDPHAGRPGREGLCAKCHPDQHALVKQNRGHAKCEACHAGLPHTGPTPPAPCLSCHEKKQPPQQGHPACESCHASHSAKVTKTCTGCHAKPGDAPLPGLHVVAKHQKCSSCHAPHTPEPGFGPASCSSCHPTLSKKSHPTPAQQCVSCHLFGGRK